MLNPHAVSQSRGDGCPLARAAGLYRREQPARSDHQWGPLEGCATCGKSAPRRSSKRPGAAQSLGSFTPRYEVSWGGLKPDRMGRGGFKVLALHGVEAGEVIAEYLGSAPRISAVRDSHPVTRHLGRMMLSSAR
jgi:hypothetical protein